MEQITLVEDSIAQLAESLNPELRQQFEEAVRTSRAANNPRGVILAASSICLTIIREFYKFAGLEPRPNDNLFSWVDYAAKQGLIPDSVANYFHNPRFLSNKADHQSLSSPITPLDADIVLLEVLRLCQWLYHESPFGAKLPHLRDDSPITIQAASIDGLKTTRGLGQLMDEMRERREIGEPFALLLGSGCSLGSSAYREIRQTLSHTDDYQLFLQHFATIPREQRLSSLQAQMSISSPSPAYLALARLISRGWFQVIVTVNQDTFLDDALTMAGVREVQTSKFSLHETPLFRMIAALERQWPPIKLIRLAQDIRALPLRTVFPDPATIDVNESRVIAKLLSRGVIAVGLRENDEELALLFGERGDSVWLLDPQISIDEVLQQKLLRRQSANNILHGVRASFDSFFCDVERTAPRGRTGTDEQSRPESYSEGDEQDITKRRESLLEMQDRLEELQHKVTAGGDELREAEFAKFQSEIARLKRETEVLSNAGEGTILGNFKILQRLGRGSFGSVYRAVHLFSKLGAAVKILDRDRSSDSQWVKRFFRGASVMHTLTHPNVVRILDLGGMSGRWCYYAMEFIDGPDLEALLGSGCIEPEARWTLASDILTAMTYAHRYPQGRIVHRDLKPANILVGLDGSARITDFDTAYIEGASALSCATQAPIGSAFYLAPELEVNATFSSQHDTRVDVYALGRILLRLFTGIPPRESLVSLVLNDREGLKSALSGHVQGRALNFMCGLIEKATHLKPDSRYSDAGEMLEAFQRANDARKSMTKVPIDSVLIEMCAIPAGSFEMGNPASRGHAGAIDQPHSVALTSGFLLATTLVTRGIWGIVWGESYLPSEELLPIENVSWHNAISFCNTLSTYYDLTPCYLFNEEGLAWDRDADGFRLPTEAEWEYACRAGTVTRYYTGDREEDLARAAWYDKNCPRGPMAVKLKQVNAFGLADMLGNIWEWCWDWFSPYDSEDTENPCGPDTGGVRVLRGGSWRREAQHCTAFWRYDSDPRTGGRSLGFRVARNLVGGRPLQTAPNSVDTKKQIQSASQES